MRITTRTSVKRLSRVSRTRVTRASTHTTNTRYEMPAPLVYVGRIIAQVSALVLVLSFIFTPVADVFAADEVVADTASSEPAVIEEVSTEPAPVEVTQDVVPELVVDQVVSDEPIPEPPTVDSDPLPEVLPEESLPAPEVVDPLIPTLTSSSTEEVVSTSTATESPTTTPEVM
jgi:hypothetical protein